MQSRYSIILILLICYFVPSLCMDAYHAIEDQKNDKTLLPQLGVAFTLSSFSTYEIGMDVATSGILGVFFVLVFYVFRGIIPFYFGNILDSANRMANSVFESSGNGIYVLLLALINSIRNEKASLYDIFINFYNIVTLWVSYLAITGDFINLIFGERSGTIWLALINLASIYSEFYHGKTAAAGVAIPGMRKIKISTAFFTILMNVMTFAIALLGHGYGIDHVYVVRIALVLAAGWNTVRSVLYGSSVVMSSLVSFAILNAVPWILNNAIFADRSLCAVQCKQGYSAKGYCNVRPSPISIAACPVDISGHFYLGLAIIIGLSRSLQHLWTVNIVGLARLFRFGLFTASSLSIIVIIAILTKTVVTEHSILDKIAGAFLGIAVGNIIASTELFVVRDGGNARQDTSTEITGWMWEIITPFALFLVFGLAQAHLVEMVKKFLNENNEIVI